MPQKNDWFFSLGPVFNARVRVICFPYAGGHTATYRSWVNALPDSVEVVRVQLPGRSGRSAELPCTCMEQLIDHLKRVFSGVVNKP